MSAQGIRLNKYIAQSGYCSRRKADELIRKGSVAVNGVSVAVLGTRVLSGDVVEVNGRRISPKSYDYFLLNKPRNTITTTSDERGRPTVMDLLNLPNGETEGFYPVGRLDRETVGVLLITNDGEFAHRLMHPSYAIEKVYRVKTKEPVQPHEIDQLKRGISLDDGMARADHVQYVNLPNKHEIGIALHEGRNRQVRRMLEALGHRTVELERVRYGGLSARGIRRGRWRRLKQEELKKLRRLVKLI